MMPAWRSRGNTWNIIVALAGRLAAVLRRAAGDAEGAQRAWACSEAYVQTNEDALQPVCSTAGPTLEAMRRRPG